MEVGRDTRHRAQGTRPVNESTSQTVMIFFIFTTRLMQLTGRVEKLNKLNSLTGAYWEASYFVIKKRKHAKERDRREHSSEHASISIWIGEAKERKRENSSKHRLADRRKLG